MKITDRIFIAGHKGLVGSAIYRNLKENGFENIITADRNQYDLTDPIAVKTFFMIEKPDYVFDAAAKVGGIKANDMYSAEFIYQNTMIQTNLIHYANEFSVKKFCFLGSVCIYPKFAPTPVKEESLLCGELEPTNQAYAIAKIHGIKMLQMYNKQYGLKGVSIMPCNLYGINDNFHSENSHVIPGLMRRFHNAKVNNQEEVKVWGSGNAMREFLYVDDMAEASLFVLELDKKIYDANTKPMLSHINIGTGKDITIKELANLIKEVVGFKGRLFFDTSMPDGTPKKLIDVSRISKMGWNYKTELKEGLQKTYEWFLKNV